MLSPFSLVLLHVLLLGAPMVPGDSETNTGVRTTRVIRGVGYQRFKAPGRTTVRRRRPDLRSSDLGSNGLGVGRLQKSIPWRGSDA